MNVVRCPLLMKIENYVILKICFWLYLVGYILYIYTVEWNLVDGSCDEFGDSVFFYPYVELFIFFKSINSALECCEPWVRQKIDIGRKSCSSFLRVLILHLNVVGRG